LIPSTRDDGNDVLDVVRCLIAGAGTGRLPEEASPDLIGQFMEHTLLVAMTGFCSADVARARAAGMAHHLTRPADLALVTRLLASRG
jgi:hypothetical protein